MGEGFVSRELAIFSAERGGGGGAGCSERLKAKTGQNLGGCDVPGVRNDEGPGIFVERSEAKGFFVLGARMSYLEDGSMLLPVLESGNGPI